MSTQERPQTAAAPLNLQEIEWSKLLENALDAPGTIGSQYSAFYPYSFLNTILLWSQGAKGPVATYARWKDLNRQVTKGQKAKSIIRPINVKTDELDEHGKPKLITRFKPVRAIFDVTQTEGDELPLVEIPDWSLERATKALDITEQPFTEMNGNIQGVSWERNYAINPVAKHPFKTTAHELGHIILGHTVPDRAAEYQTHRGQMEFQAEGTAFLVTKELGVLDDEQASDSRGYLQHWLRDERPADRTIREVFSATDKLLRAGRVATDGFVELEGGSNA